MKRRILRRLHDDRPRELEVTYEPPDDYPDEYSPPSVPYHPAPPWMYHPWTHPLPAAYHAELLARRKEKVRARRRAVRAAAIVFWFVASWVPTAFGLPGATILLWGLLGVWLTYRAVKSS